MKTLHIDIEGGWGGSSRSLYFLLSEAKHQGLSPHIIHAKAGPIANMYKTIDLPTEHVPNIFNFTPRVSNNHKILLAKLPDALYLRKVAKQIKKLVHLHGIELIHLNHQGLFFFAKLLRNLNIPIIIHNRSILPKNNYSQFIARQIEKYCDGIVFISEQNEKAYHELIKSPRIPQLLLYNLSGANPDDYRDVKKENIILYLGNIDHAKGTDRVIDLARRLKANNISYQVHVYGAARNNNRCLDEIEKAIKQEQLQAHLAYKGFTTEVHPLLAEAKLLIRPSRDNDPWGRDIIEATSFGLPIVATGEDNSFVKSGYNGSLLPDYSEEDFFRAVQQIVADGATYDKFSRNSFALAEQNFNPLNTAKRFVAFLDKALTHSVSETETTC